MNLKMPEFSSEEQDMAVSGSLAKNTSFFEQSGAPVDALEKNLNVQKLKSQDLQKGLYVGTPIIVILFAELLIYSGKVNAAVLLHATLLLALCFLAALMNREDVQKTYQALLLLPLLRLVNLSMPVFFDLTLYSFVFVYAPLAVPLYITAKNQQLSSEKLGITFTRIWVYLPLSVLVGLLLGVGEYQVIRTGYLIPDLSVLSLLKLSLVMLFFVGLIEELIFRAILQTRLTRVFGTWEGILLASLLFGFMHSGYGTPYEVLYTSFVGGILGYIFHKTRSLPLVTLVHGFVNIFLFGIIPHLGPGLGLF